jgi:RNA polymerase sigma factor (sigma-70 family)
MSESRPVPLDDLLTHREWVARVARALVPGAAADDLSQSVWLRVLQSPPRHARSLKAWLATLLRRGARDAWRGESRRRGREQRAAKPEGTPSASDVVAEADSHRHVVNAVLALAEPYRTTVLLRWFEDLGPTEIAARENVPVETVRTRLKRAHAQLAKSLDAEYGGDGRKWIAALLPLAGVTAAGSALSTKATLLGAAAAVLILAVSVSFLWPEEPSTPSPEPEKTVAEATPGPPPLAPEVPPVPAEIPPPAVPDPPDVAVAPAAPVLVVLVMAASGGGVAGAEVRVLRWTPRRADGWKGHGYVRQVLLRQMREREEIAKEKADENGRAEIEDLLPGSYVVRGDAKGFAASESRVEIADGVAAAPVLLRLSPGARLSGTVRRRDGRPCPGVTVSAGPHHETVTDAQGSYGLTDLTPGPVSPSSRM